MFAQRFPGKLEEEFSKPVESIMRCEDFKSNFARRLSNRFISRSPISSPKQDSSLKLLLEKSNTENVAENVPQRIESCPQLSKNGNMEQNGEADKPPDKQTSLRKSDIQSTEVTALNMEVETLRWQLTQTETNRQMHIALLKQIVSFLNKVREHIEFQSTETVSKKGTILGRSFNAADLPRSRSVLHVNKNVEFSLSTSKKISTRKISKSISNVNGFKDSAGVWSQSKLSLTPEIDNSQKISEEMSRLITLANTVLSTKIPDLASTCNENNEMNNIMPSQNVEKEVSPKFNESSATINSIDEDIKTTFILNTIGDSNDTYNGITVKLVETTDNKINHITVPPSTQTSDLEDEFSGVLLQEKDQQNTMFNKNCSDSSIGKLRKVSLEKRNDYNSSNFIEDESGFSSMNSFQEIGIPIISIIPPSPCKEMGYMDIPDILEESEKWKTDTMELQKQTVKVFWV